MAETKYANLLQKRMTADEWAASNPLLLEGQFGLDTTSGIVKLGNGRDLWLDLPALNVALEFDPATGLYRTDETANPIVALTGSGQLPAGVRQTLADNISNSRTVEGAALAGEYGKRQGALEFSDDFTQHPDGTPGEALTGQQYSLHSATDPNGQPFIANGYLTYGDTDYLGGYATVEFEQPVVRFGASFAFTPWTTGGGLACLAAMSQDIKDTAEAGQGVPASPFHLTIAPDAWGVDVFTATGTAPTRIDGGVFTSPLTADGTTLHRVDVVLDRENALAYLTLPTGERRVISTPYLRTEARFVYIEPYRDNAAQGKTKPLFRNFWGDSRNQLMIPEAKANTKAVQGRWTAVTENMPGTQSDVVLNSAPAKIPGATVEYVVPESGTVLITLEGLIDVTAAGPVHFGIVDESDALTSVRTVATKVMNGRVSLRLPVSTGRPGDLKRASMCAYLGGSAAARLLLGTYGNPAIYAGASIMVVPT